MNYTVTVDAVIFEELVRESEKIAVLKRYNDAGMYISSADLFCILGFEQKVGDDPELYLNKEEDGNEDS